MSALVKSNGNATLVSQGGYIPSYDLAGIQSASKILFESGMFTDVRSAAQACVKVMAGAELGIPPFASMQGIHIIKGKPTLSAGVMAGKVKASGRYDFRVTENTDKAVEITFFERGEEIGRSRFTIEDARRAETQNTGKFPRNMLYARAMSNGVKWFAPDIFLGPIYTPDELGAQVNDEGEIIEARQVNTATGEVIEPRYTRNSDPPRDAVKHETLDGRTIHQPVIDPATNRPVPPTYRNEPEPETPSFAYGHGMTDEEAVNAAALRKGLGSHKGWLVNKGLEPDNKALSLYLLNRAERDISGEMGELHDEPWTSRKELTAEHWHSCNNALAKLTAAELKSWVADYHATIEREEAGAVEDPFEDEAPLNCPACGLPHAEGACTVGAALPLDVPATAPRSGHGSH